MSQDNYENYIDYLKNLTDWERKDEIHHKILETRQDIQKTEEFLSAITGANANGWYIEDCDLEDDIEVGEEECTVTVSFKASGEQDEERGICGNEITGTVEAVIDKSRTVTYQNAIAEIVDLIEEEDYDSSDDGSSDDDSSDDDDSSPDDDSSDDDDSSPDDGLPF